MSRNTYDDLMAEFFPEDYDSFSNEHNLPKTNSAGLLDIGREQDNWLSKATFNDNTTATTPSAPVSPFDLAVPNVQLPPMQQATPPDPTPNLRKAINDIIFHIIQNKQNTDIPQAIREHRGIWILPISYDEAQKLNDLHLETLNNNPLFIAEIERTLREQFTFYNIMPDASLNEDNAHYLRSLNANAEASDAAKTGPRVKNLTRIIQERINAVLYNNSDPKYSTTYQVERDRPAPTQAEKTAALERFKTLVSSFHDHAYKINAQHTHASHDHLFGAFIQRASEYQGHVCQPLSDRQTQQFINGLIACINVVDEYSSQEWVSLEFLWLFMNLADEIIASHDIIFSEKFDDYVKLALENIAGEPHEQCASNLLKITKEASDNQKAKFRDEDNINKNSDITEMLYDTQYALLKKQSNNPSANNSLEHRLCIAFNSYNKDERTVECLLGIAEYSEKNGLTGIFPFSKRPEDTQRLLEELNTDIPELCIHVSSESKKYVKVSMSRAEFNALASKLRDTDPSNLLILRKEQTLSIKATNRDKGKGVEKYLTSKSSRNLGLFKRHVNKHEKNEAPEKFPFDRMLKIPSLEEPAITTEMQSWEILYEYQKQTVQRAIQLISNGFGVMLAHDMGLGKTIQSWATLQQFGMKNGAKLIVCPKSVLLKWKKEGIEKAGENPEQIKILEKEYKDISFKPGEVIVITYEKLLYELKKPRSALRTASGFLDHTAFDTFTEKETEKLTVLWDNIFKFSNLDRKAAKHFWLAKNKGLRRLPTQAELETLLECLPDNLKVEINLLTRWTLSLYVYQQLQHAGFISEIGMVLKPATDLTTEQLYPEELLNNSGLLSLSQAQETLNTAYERCCWDGIVMDEGHKASNPSSETYKYLSALSHRIAAKKGLRLLLSGTPFQNQFLDIWSLHEILNPDALESQNHFMGVINGMLSNAANLLKTAAKSESSANVEALITAAKGIYEQLHQLRQLLAQCTLRLHKTDEVVLAEQNRNEQLSIPMRVDEKREWKLSKEQQALFDQLEPRAIESACRGFAFIDIDSDEEDNEPLGADVLKGFTLLHHLEKLLDHPMLVDKKWHDTLYNKLGNWENFKDKIREIIQADYNGDINAFIKASGKLAGFMTEAENILKADPDHQILVPITSIPMAAALEVCLEAKSGVEVKTYQGALNDGARQDLINAFNEDENTCRVVLLSESAGGFGIELYASHVMPYSSGWNPYVSLQANDRAFRADSPRETVTVIEWQCDNPFDKKLRKVGQEKMQWGYFCIDQNPECQVGWLLDRIKTFLQTLSRMPRAVFNACDTVVSSAQQQLGEKPFEQRNGEFRTDDKRKAEGPAPDAETLHDNKTKKPKIDTPPAVATTLSVGLFKTEGNNQIVPMKEESDQHTEQRDKKRKMET